MKPRTSILLWSLVVTWSVGAAGAEDRLTGEVRVGEGEVVVRYGGRPLMVYAFAPGQHKPYVRELHALTGENVLRDAPPDHLHHHGLMLAARVNGVNFWEEREPAGRQVGESDPVLRMRDGRGGKDVRPGEVVLVHAVRWQPVGLEAAGAALLRERRELRLSVDAEAGEVALEWRSEFRLGDGVRHVVWHGPDYNGLGLRLPESFDRVAEFENAAGLTYSEAQSFDVRPADWTAVTAGGPLQVVLASHRSNPGRHSFFSMRNPFAYLAATPEPGRLPLEFSGAATFGFRHLLLVRSGRLDRGQLQQRLGPWTEGP